MTWLSVLLALLRVTSGVLDYMRQRQLIEAGQAKQIAENLNASMELIAKANKARADAGAAFDKRGGVPDDKDPNLRD